MEIKTINIIGSGNVAHYLVKVLHPHIKILSVYSKVKSRAKSLADLADAEFVDDLSLLNRRADLNIVCIKDDAISDVVQNLPKEISTVHTSGAVGISVLNDFLHSGILYPLQTISKSRIGKLGKIPFLIEANSNDFEQSLLHFCNKYFSANSLVADSKIRLKIHVAAVLANNFSNYFLIKAKEILDDTNIDFEILRPLMMETIEKAFDITPKEAQTGPARRWDEKTLLLHENLISNSDLKKLYALISEMIKKEY